MSVSAVSSSIGPFGNTDGSRADLQDLLRDFVPFAANPAYAALATSEGDLTARVLVGKMGAGKTVYLRRFQAFTSKQSSVYADSVEQDPPGTETIVRPCHWYPKEILVEKWMALWKRAILRSVVSHVLCVPQLAQHLEPAQRDALAAEYPELYREFSEPLSIYSQLTEIIHEPRTPDQLNRYLRHARWQEFERKLSNALRVCPPVCFYVDAVDEEFANAPMYWLKCQQGLFYQLMRFLRDDKIGGRLHLVASIRDLVLSSVLRTEHGSKYRGEPHIRVLDWDDRAIRYFLREKLRRLPDEYFLGDPDDRTVRGWLGRTELRNEARGITEDVEDYLIRHTRLIPRDVVYVGNQLCQEILRTRETGCDALADETIRDIVAKAARGFGDNQLAICATQLAADAMPAHAVQHGYSGYYIGSDAYSRGLVGTLKTLIGAIGGDRFSVEQLAAFETLAKAELGAEIDAASVLWQNGLLGYGPRANRPDDVVFYAVRDMEDFTIPLDQAFYAFHPCVIDSVGISGVGEHPVRPFARRSSGEGRHDDSV
jgi:hypothetical protein